MAAGEPTMVGKYVLQGELARGGMGVVYRALDPVLRRPCALKLMLDGGVDASGVERFLREARALARLRHPGIVDIYDAGVHGGQPFLVMELLQGGSLAALVKREGPLDVRRALELLDRVARAIDAAHAEKILHRDLKPANVLLDAEGAPRVTDFGLARDTSGREQAITLGDQMLGTPNYMAPEQAGGEGHLVGPRSDVYGLGALLFELVTGKPPFAGATAMNIVTQKLRGAPSARALHADLPADVEFIIKRAMAVRPEDRYDSAAALAADVRRHLEGRPTEARPAGPLERAWKLARRHRALVTLGAAVLVLGTIGAGLVLQARTLRRQGEARELEAHALARLEAGVPEGELAALEAQLARVTALDPARAAAWRARARLALEHDPDLARRCLEAAGPEEGPRGERAYVEGRLAEAAGDATGAAARYAAAREADSREPDLRWRAARAQARSALARGWPDEAAAACWEALREDPDDGEALATIVGRWLATGDLEGLSRGWEELYRRLRADDEAGWQTVAQADQEQVVAALKDERAPPSARVRAAVAGSLFQRWPVQEALEERRRAGPPLLVEAARATGLAMDDVSLADWVTTAAVTTWADGAAQALTLVEHAHRLRPEDAEALQVLAREARGPLLRGAVAVAVAVAATRAAPLPPELATALLDKLRGDADARVATAAVAAAGALEVLRGRTPETEAGVAGGLLLAQRLLRSTDRPGPLLPQERAPDDAWLRACDAALARTPSAPLLVARAEDQLERGPADWLAAARADLERALTVAPADLGARTLLAQLRLLERPSADDDLAPRADDDPAALRAARLRVAFTRVYRVAALDAGGGALRVVARPNAGLTASGFDLLSPEAVTERDAVRTVGVTVVRSRFHLVEARSICARGSTEPRSPAGFVVRAHAPVAGGLGGYRLTCSAQQRAGFRLDGTPVVDGGPVDHTQDGVTATLRRAETVLRSDVRPVLEAPGVVRTSRMRGPVDLEWGWSSSAFLLRRVVIVGRWDGATDAWPALPPASRLTPAPGEHPLLAERIETPTPRTLGLLRARGVGFKVGGRGGTWVGGEAGGQVLFARGLRRDFALQARVALQTSRDHVNAGLALRSTQGRDFVWLSLVHMRDAQPSLRGRTLWLTFQRSDEWNKPVAAAEADLSGTLMRIERRGDYVLLRAAPPGRSELEDICPPLYFPFEGPVDACLYGRRTVGGDDFEGAATFSEVELLLPE